VGYPGWTHIGTGLVFVAGRGRGGWLMRLGVHDTAAVVPVPAASGLFGGGLLGLAGIAMKNKLA